MPSSGLSLAGFMDLPWAIEHFRHDCLFADNSEAALTAEWNRARAKLGPPAPNAGRPEHAPLPGSADAYLRTATANPYLADWLERIRPFTFKLIETGPLLASQPIVDTATPARYGGTLSSNASINELLDICIPAGEPKAELRLIRSENSFLIRSSAHLAVGGFQGPGNKVGVEFGLPLPFVQVVEYGGRCYITNGYHRAVTLGRLGITRLPCLFRQAASWDRLGIRQGNTTISKQVLEFSESADHFSLHARPRLRRQNPRPEALHACQLGRVHRRGRRIGDASWWIRRGRSHQWKNPASL